MEFTFKREGVDYEEPLPTGDILGLRARNIRRERTGTHALVAVTLGNSILDSDTFNIDRREDRARLVKAAHGALSSLVQEVLPLTTLNHTLMTFLRAAPEQWEERRFSYEQFDPSDKGAEITFALGKYIIEGGGTIAFGPPESAKSYITQLMAVCIAQGISDYWEVGPPRPVLYINLERPRNTLVAREWSIRSTLGVTGKSGVTYLNTRGAGMAAIGKSVTRFITDHPDTVVFQDSISRAGHGSLKEDDVANKIIDQLNGWGTWLGIAHTPRATADHSFGSIHFEAGQDIGIQMRSETRGDTVGVRLEVTKMNDAKKPLPAYYSLEFAEDGSGLVGFRAARSTEYPELAIVKSMSRIEQIVDYLGQVGKATGKEISEATGIYASDVSNALRADLFVRLPKEGREVPFGLRETISH